MKGCKIIIVISDNQQNKKEDFLVSIIIPVYNAERTLERCLNSVITQTYQNLEVLLVDDGSTDRSAEICHQYSKKIAYIKVFHIKNGGVASARNFALKNATGDFITFIDSDDLILSTYIARLLELAIVNNKSVVTCCAIDLVNKDVKLQWNVTECKPQILSVEKGFDYTKENAHTVVWGGLYNKSILDELVFDTSLSVGEDTLFFAHVLKKARTILYIDEPLYCYVQYEQSLSKGKMTDRRMTEALAWKKVCTLFKDENRKFLNSCYARYAVTCVKLLHQIAEQETINLRWRKDLTKEIRKSLRYALCSKLGKKMKIVLLICCFMPITYFKLKQS